MNQEDVAARLRARIRAEGPLPVEAVMAEANAAYYARGTAIGGAGDFITAPEISQIFGEIIGLWLAVVWQQMGSPARVLVAECGPGHGTLMADALRALAPVPAFRDAIDLHLVETSPALRARQGETLGDAVSAWHDDLAGLPMDAPLLLVANEFLDALPVRQVVRKHGRWHLRRVALEGDGASAGFVFVDGEPVAAGDLAAPVRDGAPDGAIAETHPAGRAVMADLGRRLSAQGGAALLIDYGHATSAVGETLQAVRGHRPTPVLTHLGKADLTSHVDFQEAGAAARLAGARTHGPVEQGRWLQSLGAEMRASALQRAAPPEQAGAVREALHRLIDPARMGSLFKAMCVTAPDTPCPPGFEEAAAP